MADRNPRSRLVTHEVTNQPEPRVCAALWDGDPVLREAVSAGGADLRHLARAGARFGAQEMRADGVAANRHPPELRLFDRAGRRLDEVAFHPAYHRLMEAGIAEGYAALPWEGGPGGHVTHAGLVYMLSQVEPGVCCPMTMSYAAVPALAADPALSAVWRPLLLSRQYDPASRPVPEKAGVTLGMAMTEKQGGSDLRANATVATPDGDGWRLRGHKWFCSAPMSDGFLTLARTGPGLTCFLVPRWTPDGQRNGIQIQRLKDKLGNRANASAEIEYHDAWAQILGEPGQGLRTIIEMVHHTRLDTALAPAGLMRAALAEALWWVSGRSAFQRRLIDQPLMRAVLADLVLDWEAATQLAFRVARAFDGAAAEERAFARIAVALAKYLNNRLCPGVVFEAMECLGGIGYVEETPLPLLYREAPLNAIWEGSGNVICLDVLRTLAREPLAAEALRAELRAAEGTDRRYDAALARHEERWPKGAPEAEARWFTESLALLLAGALLLRQAPAAVADGFVASRLAGAAGVTRGITRGAVAGLDTAALLGRVGHA